MSDNSFFNKKGSDIASAAALTLGSDGDVFHVTGTTTITSISTRPAGFEITLIFDDSLTLTHNATSLILQNSTNLITAAGDVLKFVSEGPGKWRESGRRLASAAGPTAKYAVICDQKTAGTDGGTFTNGAWRTRDLNTEIYDSDGIVSIASNQFTLQAGTYRVRWQAPAFKVDIHNTRLRNITDGTTIESGTSQCATTATGVEVQEISFGWARFTIAAQKAFEIQHYCSVTVSTFGFGRQVGGTTGVAEKYTVVEIVKE